MCSCSTPSCRSSGERPRDCPRPLLLQMSASRRIAREFRERVRANRLVPMRVHYAQWAQSAREQHPSNASSLGGKTFGGMLYVLSYRIIRSQNN